MRDRAAARVDEPALDGISAQLAEVLRRADALLVEWSAFGAEVRRQVDREAAAIGEVVATAIDRAAITTTAASVDRAFGDELGARLAALTAELTRLEARARASTRAISDARHGDRRVLWGVIAGIVVANGLLVMLLLRGPTPVVVAPLLEQPVRVEPVAPIAPPVTPPPVTPAPAPVVQPQGSGSAITPAPTPSRPATKPVTRKK